MGAHYGFKKITVDNFMEPDMLGTDTKVDKAQLSLFVSDLLEYNLSESVPDETKAIYEVARGTMIYGYNFYPLYTVGTEQLLRVLENAMKMKCYSIGIDLGEKYMTFNTMKDKLIKEKVIPEEDRELWENFRLLRNMVSHPNSQNLLPPAIAIRTLKSVTEQINKLFVKKQSA